MILEGKTLAAQIRQPLKQRAEAVRQKWGRPIHLSCIGYDGDPGAVVYLNKEMDAARALGVTASFSLVAQNTSAGDFLTRVKNLSQDQSVNAILIPRPLPPHLAASGFERVLAPEKDIDGMSHISMGNLFLCKTWDEIQALKTFIPCTAMAVMRLLEFYAITLEGKETAVIGRSSTVGRPLAHLLSCKNATVKLCHSKTLPLKTALTQAELICSAVGRARFLKAGLVNPKATVIDIATTWDDEGKLCGDADAQAILQKGGSLSPVPGGVGPVTLACLLENIILSGERKI